MKEILIFEEHSSVLPEWKRRGIQSRSIIYLDAHLDLQFISQARLETIQQCKTSEDLAQLEKPHFLLPDKGYSYSIEDFLYPAHRLGIIERLIWVCPPNYFNSEKDLSNFVQEFQLHENFTPEDLKSFQRTGNIITARLLGLDIVMCRYEDLAELEIPANSLIDIDTDYFVTPKGLWIDPQQVFESLDRLPLESDFVTLTRSVSSGHTPLRYNFLADYLAALWGGDRQIWSHYARLFELDRKAQKGDPNGTVEGCLDELRRFPKSAATYYLLSLYEKNSDRSIEYHHKATSICPTYGIDVLRSACELLVLDRKFNRTTLEKLEQQLQDTQVSSEELPLIHVILGMLYGSLGKLRQTFKHYSYCKKMTDRHPRLSLLLGKLLYQAGYFKRAITYTRGALLDDSTRPNAHLLLSHFYLKQQQLELAKENLLQAIELLPSCVKAVKMLANLYKRMGDEENYRAMLQRSQQMSL